MSKDTRHNKSVDFSSASDKSEVSYEVKCTDKNKSQGEVKSYQPHSPEQLIHKYKDAVVEIHSEFILLGSGFTGLSGPTGSTPLAPNSRADIIVQGNGFFIKGHYIITPAHLVLLPPSLTSVANRYPYFDRNALALGSFKNHILRASRILVSVFNVYNEKTKTRGSFVYEAELIGVDGAGDIAVLRIDYAKQWNICNPCISKIHPYFTFGSSRAAKDGEKVYLIGDYISDGNNIRAFNAVGAITEGVLSDHRFVDYSGSLLAEAILVSAKVHSVSSGLPILNAEGQVIGFQTTDVAGVGSGLSIFNQRIGSGFVAGPSEFFIRRIIKTIIKGTCSRKLSPHLENVCDPLGAYYRYVKGYLGLAYNIFTGVDYDVTADFTSGISPAGAPRIRLDANGRLVSSPTCKELVGVKVIGLAGANSNGGLGVPNGINYVPGGTGTIAPVTLGLPNSSLLNRLQPGDLITHVGTLALGDFGNQIAPSIITWRLAAGDQIDIKYRRGGNALNNTDNNNTENYENQYSEKVCVQEYPVFLDYPWYAINNFPLLSALPHPGFIFPLTQLTNPQLPAINGGAIFHPAV